MRAFIVSSSVKCYGFFYKPSLLASLSLVCIDFRHLNGRKRFLWYWQSKERKGYIKEQAVQKPGVKNTEKHVFPTRGPLHNVASGITWKVVVKKKKKETWIVAALKRDRDKIVFQMRKHPSCIHALLLFVWDLLCVNEPLALSSLCGSIWVQKGQNHTARLPKGEEEAGSRAKFGTAPTWAIYWNLWEGPSLNNTDVCRSCAVCSAAPICPSQSLHQTPLMFTTFYFLCFTASLCSYHMF